MSADERREARIPAREAQEGSRVGPRILIADGTWAMDHTCVVRDETGWDGSVDAPTLLPLTLYLAEPQAVHIGVWLAPTDDPVRLKPFLASLRLVAIDFPKFTDGRGYTTAAMLRRYGFRGELRAIGEVLVDQLFFLKRVGFTSFALRADQDPTGALRALHTFSGAYQGAFDQPLPAFRRHARPGSRDNPISTRAG